MQFKPRAAVNVFANMYTYLHRWPHSAFPCRPARDADRIRHSVARTKWWSSQTRCTCNRVVPPAAAESWTCHTQWRQWPSQSQPVLEMKKKEMGKSVKLYTGKCCILRRKLRRLNISVHCFERVGRGSRMLSEAQFQRNLHRNVMWLSLRTRATLKPPFT